ncbi:nuclear pore complex protein, partial [Striga asiatica]
MKRSLFYGFISAGGTPGPGNPGKGGRGNGKTGGGGGGGKIGGKIEGGGFGKIGGITEGGGWKGFGGKMLGGLNGNGKDSAFSGAEMEFVGVAAAGGALAMAGGGCQWPEGLELEVRKQGWLKGLNVKKPAEVDDVVALAAMEQYGLLLLMSFTVQVLIFLTCLLTGKGSLTLNSPWMSVLTCCLKLGFELLSLHSTATDAP